MANIVDVSALIRQKGQAKDALRASENAHVRSPREDRFRRHGDAGVDRGFGFGQSRVTAGLLIE